MGGLFAVIIAFSLGYFAVKLCDLIKAPLWLVKILFTIISFYGAFRLSERFVPEYNKPSGVWIVAICASSGIIFMGLAHINEQQKKRNEE